MRWQPLALALFLLAGAAAAQTALAKYEVELAPVSVNLNTDPAWLSYKQLKVGEAAFMKNHQFAPRADLYFALFPRQPWLDFDGVVMSLQSDEGIVPVPLGALGRFRLPQIETANSCQSEQIKNLFPAQRFTLGIRMSYGNRVETYVNPLGKNGGYVYYVPLHDQTWPDDALLELIYRDPPLQ